MITYTETEQYAIDFFQTIYDRVWTENYTTLVIHNLKEKLANYLTRSNLKTYILPLSGGLDSSIVAALCKDLPLKTVFLNIGNSKKHKKMAKQIAKQYGHEFESKDLSKEYKRMSKCMTSFGIESNIAEGNIKARLRMITAYHMANIFKGCVLSTDNYSEYNMGFWTLHGDVGDISPIQFINKGFELQYIAKALGIPDNIITQAPSDGLGVTTTNTDEAQLGANYKFVDSAMLLYMPQTSGSIKNQINKRERAIYLKLIDQIKGSNKYKKIIAQFERTQHKRHVNFNNNLFQVEE